MSTDNEGILQLLQIMDLAKQWPQFQALHDIAREELVLANAEAQVELIKLAKDKAEAKAEAEAKLVAKAQAERDAQERLQVDARVRAEVLANQAKPGVRAYDRPISEPVGRPYVRPEPFPVGTAPVGTIANLPSNLPGTEGDTTLDRRL